MDRKRTKNQAKESQKSRLEIVIRSRGISTDDSDRKNQKNLPQIVADQKEVRVIRKIESRNYPEKKGGITAAQPLEGRREILL
jgi:hypothetical protein